MELAMIDDRIVPIAQARISGHDRGTFFGDGVYDSFIVIDSRPFALGRHLRRFGESLRKMDMAHQVDLEKIAKRIDRAMNAAELPNASVYFHVTRGAALRAHDYNEDMIPSFFLTVRERKNQYLDQAAAMTYPDQRWKRCDIKSLNLLANIMARHAAVAAGAYEAILVDENNLVTEASSASVFAVKNGIIRTAPTTANILPGVTREITLEIAQQEKMDVQERSLNLEELLGADEVFLTVTSQGVLPITTINNQTIGDGRPGTVTTQLRNGLMAMMMPNRPTISELPAEDAGRTKTAEPVGETR